MRMSELEYLMICLGEEGTEVSQAASKIARFGLGNHYKETDPTNLDNFITEVNDVFAVVELLQEHANQFHCDLRLTNIRDQSLIDAKKQRLTKFIEYSKFRGVIE